MKTTNRLTSLWIAGLFLPLAWLSAPAMAQSSQGLSARSAAVLNHWTTERLRQATPRDLLIDERGLGYLRQRDGYLQPHGHAIEAIAPERRSQPSPFGKPSGGSGDTTPPTISGFNPSEGQTIGAEHTFQVSVTDDSGVSRVDIKIGIQSFQAQRVGTSDLWEVKLSGFTNGTWSYQVVAKDGAAKGGNTATTDPITFSVDTGAIGGGGNTGGGGSGGDGSSITSEAAWDADGKTVDADPVTKASGRIYFEMPANQSWRKWNGYVCSGTVALDETTGRSIIITAAHCVYDDVNKAFARNVLFIPNQNATTGSGTDTNCGNDPMGCWIPAFGVVDSDWTNKTFPDNIPSDYAFYVVPDSGAHSGTNAGNDALDEAAGSLPVQFEEATIGAFTHALGYSYSKDPSLRYCAQDLAIEGSYQDLWLGSCELSGGASGGPWVQPLALDQGTGPIISVNSWGYTTQPGMGAPPLHGNSAKCRFNDAKGQNLQELGTKPDGQQGYVGTGTACSS